MGIAEAVSITRIGRSLRATVLAGLAGAGIDRNWAGKNHRLLFRPRKWIRQTLENVVRRSDAGRRAAGDGFPVLCHATFTCDGVADIIPASLDPRRSVPIFFNIFPFLFRKH